MMVARLRKKINSDITFGLTLACVFPCAVPL